MRQATSVAPRNVDRLTRVYGPTTWDVYARLDVSLDPSGPEWLPKVAAQYVQPGDVVLDAGCRDGAHLIELVQAIGVRGVGVDPVEIHIDRANAAVQAAASGDRITLHLGVMHQLPYPDNHFDFVWCRDVLEQVDDLEGALRELVRVAKPGKRVLIYTTFVTDLIADSGREMLRRHLGKVDSNLDADFVEAAFERVGLAIETREVIRQRMAGAR